MKVEMSGGLRSATSVTIAMVGKAGTPKSTASFNLHAAPGGLHIITTRARSAAGLLATLQDPEPRNEPRNEVLLIYEPRRSLGGQVPRNEALRARYEAR